MRAVIQRVRSAKVTVAGRTTGAIGGGLVVLLGIEEADTTADGEWLAQKIAKLRIFDDAEGRMNLSLLDFSGAGAAPSTREGMAALSPSASGLLTPASSLSPTPCPLRPASVLVISQFTLFASTQKGTRPSFNRAAKPAHARPLYEQFLAQLTAALGQPPATGEFGAMMQVELVNDGPVTLVIDSKTRE